MNTKTLWGILVAGAWLAISTQNVLAAGDVEQGKKKFNTCTGCHSIEGYTNAVPNYPVPRLGGQHAESVVAALEAYADGSRKHGSMQGNASGLAEQDLADLAAYISQKRLSTETNVITGDVAKGKEKSASCAGCHGEDGNSSAPNFPRLAGQYEGYLVKALKDYKKGIRKNPIMNGIAESLSADEITNLSAYYASQQRGLVTLTD